MKYILSGLFCFLQILHSQDIVAQTIDKSISPIKSNSTTVSMLVPINQRLVAASVLGKYTIYSGIPAMYIGKFELKEGGNYIVALSSDEDSYGTGTYIYHENDNTIEWKTGFFWQKKWEGKLVNSSGGNIKIVFNKVTFGEKDDNK
jgi:hypothetical protein